ncbi:MAG TPA: hypothetical protein VMT95_12690 [Candidatus Binatia bacterium]|nr:hypothetical protein [Candidatus Binatia bacterium]
MIDRKEVLAKQVAVTGIDFVRVAVSQIKLSIYFLAPDPGTLTDPNTHVPNPLTNLVDKTKVRITLDPIPNAPEAPSYPDAISPAVRATLPSVTITTIQWQNVGGREVLEIDTDKPGGFSLYRLYIDDPRIDPYFNNIQFSFKANCESTLDCAPPDHECPLDEVVDVPIDYLARDFESIRGALLDFAAARYPAWQDRTEADALMMAVELLSGLGDEMAYYQDRVGREAFLETASERRSIRKHARLLDYDPDDGRSATSWIDVTVAAGPPGNILAGTPIVDVLPDPVHGTQPACWYEVGHGLDEAIAVPQVTYGVASALNEFNPHIWDSTAMCLPIGSTELCVEGDQTGIVSFNDGLKTPSPGRWMLLQTSPTDPSIPPRAWMVRVIDVALEHDPLAAPPPGPVTRFLWEDAQATPFELDLALLRVRGNLLPVTAGKTQSAQFAIGPSSDPQIPSALERVGHDDARTYLFSLPGSDAAQLAVLSYPPGTPDRGATYRKPEVALQTVPPTDPWRYEKSFFGIDSVFGLDSAEPDDAVFTIEDGMWRRVVEYRLGNQDFVFSDFAGAQGATIRFGDGQFGEIPSEPTTFLVTYRLAQGAADNIAAHVLTQMIPAGLGGLVVSLTNPLPALDGADPESNDRVKGLAPYAYQNVTYRAVRPEDYAEAATRLLWVEQAGASVRWTGSWPTVFVTADPRDTFSISDVQETDLAQQMDRFRQAGREVYQRDPIYANLDLKIYLCVTAVAMSIDQNNASSIDVEADVLKALFGAAGVRPYSGFFAHDNFTFGTPLERSALEAMIAAVPGVKAVEKISIRRRGWHDWRDFSELEYKVGTNEMIRVLNDPRWPDRGSVQLFEELSV